MPITTSIDFPWIRRIRVTFIGLSGENSENVYESTGRRDELRIAATIHKNIAGVPAPTELSMHNLSRDTRKSLKNASIAGYTDRKGPKAKIRIEAGWDHGPFPGLSQCFYGDLFISQTQRNGPDFVTVIHCMAALGDMGGVVVNKTWAMGMPVKNIVIEIARMMSDIEKVDPSLITGLDGMVIGERGWSEQDLAKNTLNTLARHFGFTWQIIDGHFMTVKTQGAMGSGIEVKSPYLFTLAPIIAQPWQMQTGITWTCVFDPSLVPARKAIVNSAVEPDYNNTYAINSIVHRIDSSAEGPFITEGKAFLPDLGAKKSSSTSEA